MSLVNVFTVQMRLFTQFAIAAAATACAGIRPPTPAGPLTSPGVTTVESLRNSAVDIPARLVVVVRDGDSPDRNVPGSTVFLGRDKTNLQSVSALHASAKTDGVVTFERLDPGEYAILVRQIGYEPFQFVVHLRPQCREVLEIYVGVQPLCLFECPSIPGRAVLTTCRKVSNERKEE